MKTLEGKVNAKLRKLCDWLIVNKLTLIKHTKIELCFIPPAPEKSDVFPQTTYTSYSQKNGNAIFESNDHIKYLSDLLDKNLSWKSHTITSKFSKTVGLIAKLRHFIPRCILLNIYQSLIYPSLTHGPTSWGQSLAEDEV